MSAIIPDEQAQLLAAIVAEPDEDTPRLVYADWLQENGDTEQAQFIRDSIVLARAPHGSETESLARRVQSGTLPGGVAVVLVKSKPQLYLQRMPPPRPADVVLA